MIKSAEEIQRMSVAGALTAKVLGPCAAPSRRWAKALAMLN
ncbi:hypothetical protein, partial [Pseudomonas aeruginosa]